LKPPVSPDRKRGAGKTSVATRFTDFLRQSGEQVLAATRRHPMLRTRPIQLDLDSLQNVGGPLMIPITAIDEDPEQPRLEFDDEPLKELGVSDLVVRLHPEVTATLRVEVVAS